MDLLQQVLLDIQTIKIQADDLGPSPEQIISKLLGQGTQPYDRRTRATDAVIQDAQDRRRHH